RFGSPDTETHSRSVTTDPAGNVFTLGSFKGSVDFDPGPGVFILNSGTNIYGTSFICKLDSSGNFLWAGKMDISGVSIISDKNGNILVLGTYGGSVDVDPGPGAFDPGFGYAGSTCCVKLDNAGNFIWARAFIGGQSTAEPCRGSSICIDATQHIYIGGSFAGATDFDPGPGSYKLTGYYQPIPSRGSFPLPTFFICSLDSSGNFRFAKSRGAYNLGGITCTQQGEIFAYYTNYQSVGDIRDLIFTPKQIYIEKWDVNGNFLWSKVLKEASPSGAFVFWPLVTPDRYGNIWLTGYFNGLIDFDPSPANTWNLGTPTHSDTSLFILKLNTNGDFLHASHMHRAMGKPVLINKIFTDKQASLYLGGSFKGTFDFDLGPSTTTMNSVQTCGFFMKLDENFKFKWVGLIGENANSKVSSACQDNFGNFYISGSFSGTGDFDHGIANSNLAAAGTEDAFLVKLSGPLITSIQSRELTESISFFPNPVTNLLNLNTDSEIKHGRYSVINIDGKIMLENRDISGKDFKIDLSALQPGFYIVEILDEKYKARAKIIKD
ncbi:MAG TPA: T9SS type A sorting domain-containing protein, partial [Bacteroidia bacterium]|nr:T9SS type A sorting domain-containing protein [Bacteroidia bacterium]